MKKFEGKAKFSGAYDIFDIVIVLITALCFAFVSFFQYYGIVTVIPHILYIPIILFAYRYPDRGVLFAFIIAVLYLILFDIIISAGSELYVDAIGRTVVFVIIGILVSYISKEMHSQKGRYLSLFNNLTDSIFVIETGEKGAGGRITDCNLMACESVGYTKEELTEMKFSSLVSEEDLEKIENVDRYSSYLQPLVSEVLLIGKDGLKISFDLIMHKYRIGIKDEIIIVAHNPLKRHEAEGEVAESRLKLEESLKIAGLGSCEKAMDESFLIWSDETFRIFNIPSSPDKRIKSSDFLSLVHPDFKDILKREYNKSVLENKEFSLKFKVIKKDGKERWINSHCRHSLNEKGRVIRSLGTFQDITENIAAEMKAYKQAKFFETLIETIPLPVFHKDKYGIYRGCNQAFANLSGKSKEFIIGKTVFDIFDEKVALALSEIDNLVLKMSGIQISETEITDSNKIQRSMIISKAAIMDENGETCLIIGVMQDITDLKKTKQNLKKSLEEKSILLQEVHHRVKNNLASITGILEIEKSRIKDKEALNFLNEAENRIQSMVIVHESLYHSVNIGEIDAYDHFRNLFESVLISYSPAAEIILELDTSGCKIDINSAIPCSLVVNEILTNSMKYAFFGMTEGKITINLQCSENKYILVISDNGCGIPENFIPDKSPTLGMKVIYNIVRLQLMGTITLSRENGTKWTIIWPKKL
ncbi:MAG: PAS domain S-box protein [Methanomicrobium sp.]|nr:PAS domain S-box protein [Methanomicrobium sp.]